MEQEHKTFSARLADAAMYGVAAGVRMDVAMDYFRRVWLELALAANGQNQSVTAARLGVHRNTLARRMERFGVESAGHHVPQKARCGQ